MGIRLLPRGKTSVILGRVTYICNGSFQKAQARAVTHLSSTQSIPLVYLAPQTPPPNPQPPTPCSKYLPLSLALMACNDGSFKKVQGKGCNSSIINTVFPLSTWHHKPLHQPPATYTIYYLLITKSSIDGL